MLLNTGLAGLNLDLSYLLHKLKHLFGTVLLGHIKQPIQQWSALLNLGLVYMEEDF